MAITVKHNKVSTVPDDTDTSLVRPSDWNADHTLVGTIDVANGGTGASTLTGYVKGNGTSAMTAVATVPSTDITGLGTMSTQNATAVAITGGTINGTTIGATTPSTVNATTITGQTGVLRGTGQNLLTYSQTFTDASWTKSNVSATGSAGTAPDSTNTATSLAITVASAAYLAKAVTTAQNVTYTASIYVKAVTSTWFYFQLSNGAQSELVRIWFNSADGSVGTNTTSGSATIVATNSTAVGNSWYRISISATLATTTSATFWVVPVTANGGGTSPAIGVSMLVWGSQLEIGSTANTYIPTTTTAVYGTPTLSFSGVSSIGLLSNGALYLQPAGTGALQAQATTSTTAGGNARGANATDWQTSRDTAARVASGSTSFIGSGRNNTSSGQDAFVGAGFQNTASNPQAAVVSGARNTATSPLTFVGSGSDNNATAYGSVIVGGQSNTAAGYFNLIGCGSFNSGTSGSAVTTQATTAVTSGSTAVTLSGSNANIKVGQIIAGTGIVFPDTYVAAISGTSLTLSRTATATGTPTLSFFTPHGVVVGGGNNQATGSYSFIGGGGDAGTAANRNVASGDWSVVLGGRANTASGIGSVVGGGGTTGGGVGGNTASGIYSTVVSGISCTASAEGAFIGNGYGNIANGALSFIGGGARGTTRSITGNAVFPAHANPIADASGINQAALLILGTQTTDATATALRSNSSAAGTTNQVILPNNSAYFFTGEVISGVTGGGNTKGFTIEGVIKRGANAASTALVGTPTVTSTYADAGASAWTIAVTADTTNGGIRVTFTGQAATTIRTVCQIRTTEMTY